MNKLQWFSIFSCIALILVLYFGCNTKPPELQEAEKSRSLIAESADAEVLIRDAKAELGTARSSGILAAEQQLDNAPTDSLKVEFNKQLSGLWFELGYYAIAGYYAQQVAELLNTEESWSIAGTTYSIGIQRSDDDRIRSFCAGRAVQAFENAISINPENTAHQVNLALVYAEQPSSDNPMQGIQMLLRLNNEEPENVLVLTTLGRLAIKTGQYDRAKERLEKAVALEPNNRNAVCLLAQVYQELQETDKASNMAQRCQNMEI